MMPVSDALFPEGPLPLGYQHLYTGAAHFDFVQQSLSGIMTKRDGGISIVSLRYEQKILVLFKVSSCLPGKIWYTKGTEREQ